MYIFCTLTTISIFCSYVEHIITSNHKRKAFGRKAHFISSFQLLCPLYKYVHFFQFAVNLLILKLPLPLIVRVWQNGFAKPDVLESEEDASGLNACRLQKNYLYYGELYLYGIICFKKYAVYLYSLRYWGLRESFGVKAIIFLNTNSVFKENSLKLIINFETQLTCIYV